MMSKIPLICLISTSPRQQSFYCLISTSPRQQSFYCFEKERLGLLICNKRNVILNKLSIKFRKPLYQKLFAKVL